MSKKLRELKAQRAAKQDEARGIHSAAATAGRDLTADENTRFSALMDDVERLSASIATEERAVALGMSADSGGHQLPAGGTGLSTSHDNRADDPKRGFSTKGEYLAAVVAAGRHGSRATDERLLIGAAAPGVAGNEGAGADGGFLVPPEYSREIFTLSQGDDSLLPYVDEVVSSSNQMVFPQDETTPWGTDGIRAYWQAEASAANATKPVLGTSMLRMNKLMGLVPLTEELVVDANALESYAPPLVARSIRWKTNEAILLGDGVGKPKGMFSSNAAVVVAKETNQAAGTLVLDNITNMVARLPVGSFPRSVWLITPDLLPALFGMTLGNYPIYLPVSAGAQGSPYGTLMGRPIWVSQHAAARGAQGDLLLMDGSYYRALTHKSGVRQDVSMHLYFDAAAIAFRVIFRVDGGPKITKPIDQAKGSNKLSPFLLLGARA